MKLNRFAFSMIMLACTVQVMADDSIAVEQATESRYERSLERRQQIWASLIPTHFVIQNAGNMGLLSAGIGWSYGKNRKWETDLLIGFIPRHDSSRLKVTTTLKGNYIPWRIDLTPNTTGGDKPHWLFEPLTASLYLNTVYGSEFWKSQPSRYPTKYYEFMSTKFRLNVAFGQRITLKVPDNKRRRHSRIALFYEIGSCDLYIRSLFQGQDVSIGDIIGLSIGAKFFTL